MAIDSECSSCGSALTIKNAASLYAVCQYCGTTSIREADALKAIGKAASLIEDGSPLQLHTTGRFKGAAFEIIGRIQLQFDAGYWNEWHLDYHGESVWLGEATGKYVFTRLVKDHTGSLPTIDELIPGQAVDTFNKRFFVTDIQKGKCISGEGELPFSFTSGFDAPVVDMVSSNEEFATIDYSEEKPLLFVGEYASFHELHLQNLRYLEGWPKPGKAS